MFKRLLIAIVFGTLMLGVVLPVLAETADTMQGRLQQAVTDNSISLNDEQRASLIEKCPNAQATLSKIQADTDQLTDERITVYTDIQKELQAIKLRMVRQGADASETDLLTGKIQQTLEEFEVLVSGYKIALQDVTGIDCQQQPEYFKAGLIITRIKRAEVLDASLRLKAVVHDADDDIFTQLKRRLVI
jgi:hypothetical protein